MSGSRSGEVEIWSETSSFLPTVFMPRTREKTNMPRLKVDLIWELLPREDDTVRPAARIRTWFISIYPRRMSASPSSFVALRHANQGRTNITPELQPARPVSANGRPIAEPTCRTDG